MLTARNRAWLMGWVLMCSAPVFGLAPTEAPPPPAEPPTTGRPGRHDEAAASNALGGKEWELTSYLKGNASQIRDKLNGEVERMIVKVRETETGIREIEAANKKIQAAFEADKESAREKVRQSAAYKQIASERTKAEMDLAAARKNGSTQDRLEASTRFNKARAAVDKMEQDAMALVKPRSDDGRRYYDLAHRDLPRYKEGLDKAVAWRDELLEAIRNSFCMKGEMKEGAGALDVIDPRGATGTLPRCRVAKIVDGSHVIVDYTLLTFDLKHPGKDKEEIKQYYATTTKLKILLSGIDTSKMKEGDKLNIDHMYVLDGSNHTEIQGTIYTASPKPNEVDILFDTIVPLRESPETVVKKNSER